MTRSANQGHGAVGEKGEEFLIGDDFDFGGGAGRGWGGRGWGRVPPRP
jgi:hypothetical protein